MTEIRWKNGGPLFLQPSPGSEFGLVATDQDCCCPPPPPPRCWDCLDTCAYFIEVVEPSNLAAKTPALNCPLGPASEASTSIPFDFKEFLPEGTTYFGWLDESRATALNSGWMPWGQGYLLSRFYGQVWHRAAGYVPTDNPLCTSNEPGAPGPYPTLFSVNAEINASVYCNWGKPETPFTLVVNMFVIAGTGNWGLVGLGDCGRPCFGNYSFNATAVFDLSSSCQEAEQRQCIPPQDQFRILDTPFTVSADKDGTSFGAYQSVTESSCGDNQELVESIGHQIRDALTATFRITSRPNCKTPIPCDCSASLAGTRWSFEGQDFDWNTGGESWFGEVKFTWNLSGSSPNVVYEFYDPLGPVDVNGNPSRLLSQRRVDVYCDTVDGVPTWVVLLRATGFCYDGGGTFTGQSTDSWLGRLLCYEACADDWHASGDPIPSGEPEDVVFSGRETLFDECPPAPPRPTVLISQIETC